MDVCNKNITLDTLNAKIDRLLNLLLTDNEKFIEVAKLKDVDEGNSYDVVIQILKDNYDFIKRIYDHADMPAVLSYRNQLVSPLVKLYSEFSSTDKILSYVRRAAYRYKQDNSSLKETINDIMFILGL